jgi:chitin synthase
MNFLYFYFIVIIYILAIPVFGFFIPIYSFWNMDDFSWGNTRVILSDKGERKVVREEDEYFDISQIKHMRWDDYQSEVLENQTQTSQVMDMRGEQPLDGFDGGLATNSKVMHRMSMNSHRSRPISMNSHRSSFYAAPVDETTQPSKRISGANFAPPPTVGMPTDAELRMEIHRILASADLMRLSKRSVREELSAFYGVDLSPKKDFINTTIDSALNEYM